MSDVRIVDNSKKVLNEFLQQKKLALAGIGEAAEGFAKEQAPVDTGRLRNSITYATGDYEGIENYHDDIGNNFSGGAARSKPGTDSVVIGSNVEYAPQMEFSEMQHQQGNAHFLKNAVVNHSEKYKSIAKAAFS